MTRRSRLTLAGGLVLALLTGGCAGSEPVPVRAHYVAEAPCVKPAADGRCNAQIRHEREQESYIKYLWSTL